MAMVLTDDKHYKNIANEIRSRLLTDKTYKPEQMPNGINDVLMRGFTDGNAEGYERGKNEGYTEGLNKGFVDGSAEGYERGKTDGYNEGLNKGLNQGFVNGRAEGIEQGKQTAYDEFWDSFQLNGTRRTYTYTFAGLGWTDISYNPKYDIICDNSAGYMYAYATQITSTKKPITLNGANAQAVFLGCTRLTTIPSIKITSNVTSLASAFASCTSLVNITFTEDSAIVADINLGECPLNKASIVSVINALFGTVTGKTATFKKTAKEAAFTDDEWAALKATKENWTIKDESGNIL